ncbi:MAG TPA: DUF3710 domain-containing protein [Mycobacteriales bacterium]|nr:DUF3710 domain-containing protein [Mycobacteriales bacterium]
MFRRRRRDADDTADDELRDDELGDELDVDGDTESGRRAEPASAERAAPSGPWDAADAPDDDVPRLDLGALLVPVPEGLEVRVDMQDQTVVAATLVDGQSALQLHAFAAPRSSGIWAEVRAEIADSVRESGGSANDSEGPFGAELHARVPTEVPGQGVHLQPLRFLGVDGPRWFLRGLLSGPASTDPVQGRRLLEAFGGTIVVRGGEAMAPRDMLPLHLPKDALAAAQPEETPARPGLEILERGPEITETR